MLIELDELLEFDAVEVIKQIELLRRVPLMRPQVLDDGLRLDLLLNVDGRDGNGQGFQVFLILALPHQLRVQRRVARVEHGAGLLFILSHKVPQLLGGDIFARLIVREMGDFFGGLRFAFSGHGRYSSRSGSRRFFSSSSTRRPRCSIKRS